MAFDGVVISNLVHDFNRCLIGGRINKIYQPEDDEILLVIKNERQTYRLFLSASASLPLLYFASEKKENPMAAPNFCMLLRKHISNGRIVAVRQPEFERIVDITVEHLNELNDVCQKHLVIEIMGKHSNIIFCDESYKILDSIKHISMLVSSVREVLPGREYQLPPNQGKCNPMDITLEQWKEQAVSKPVSCRRAIYQNLTGISPLVAGELCYEAGVDADTPVAACDKEQLAAIYEALKNMRKRIEKGEYTPQIVYENDIPVEFSVIPLLSFSTEQKKEYDSVSEVLESYYAEKNKISKIRQKSAELRHIVSTAIERTAKKLDLQEKQLKDTEKREQYKVYGELINVYGYGVEPGARTMEADNYYTGEKLTIPLEPTISVMDNGKKYFQKYNKLKRTYEALSTLTLETRAELMHLQSIQASLDMALLESDLIDIKEELIQYGYMKRHNKGKKVRNAKSKPLHYISSDGFHMYVGKNNFQNDELTFKVANTGDWWFHANDIPGSHVIVKKEQAEELPDATFEEAARLAAYYSSGRTDSKVEIDYTTRGNLKKPKGAKPGFVIYHTNYSIIAVPDITGIKQI